MNSIDFSKAPEGATHYCASNGKFYRGTSSRIEVWSHVRSRWFPSQAFNSLSALTPIPAFEPLTSCEDAQPIGSKHDTGKPLMGAVPPNALLSVAEVLTFGAQKYTVAEKCDTITTGKIIEDELWLNGVYASSAQERCGSRPRVCVAHVIEKQRLSELYANAVVKKGSSPRKTADAVLVTSEKDLASVLESTKQSGNIYGGTECAPTFWSGKKLENNAGEKTQNTWIEREKSSGYETYQNTGYRSFSMNVFVRGDAQSAAAESAHTLTTTIQLGCLEIYFAVSAIKLLDCFKILPLLLRHYLGISVSINDGYCSGLGRDNWHQVENAETRYMDAALRHINAYQRGEQLDPESGENHLAHAVCSLMFILEKETRPAITPEQKEFADGVLDKFKHLSGEAKAVAIAHHLIDEQIAKLK